MPKKIPPKILSKVSGEQAEKRVLEILKKLGAKIETSQL